MARKNRNGDIATKIESGRHKDKRKNIPTEATGGSAGLFV